jgi:hypothetical protein
MDSGSGKRKAEAMGHPHYSKEEIVRRGEELYEQQIRGQIDEERNKGKALVIESRPVTMRSMRMAWRLRAQARHPDAALYAMRIGYPAYAKIGGGWGAAKP